MNNDDGIFQSFPDFFYEKPASLSRETTNPRYPFFRQIHFTAGDYEQFLRNWKPNVGVKRRSPVLDTTIRYPATIQWSKYRNICCHDVFSTYMYIFEKFKKGIFIQLYQKQLQSFLPFSKVNYKNEWSHIIHLDKTKYQTVVHLMKSIAETEKRPFVESKVHKDVKAWYGNNGLVRLEYPISEGDSGCNMLKNMFDTLAIERNIPDMDFFLHKRDFPILTLDGTEPYDSFFKKGTPLVSHNYERYTPILSMTTTSGHADIPIPTWEDWCRVSYWYDKRVFGKEFRTFPTPSEFDGIAWEDKKPTAVFRGVSTGLGTRLDNNPRLFFAAESKKQRKDVDGNFFLDAGITRWNLRPRKHPDSPYLETIEVHNMPFDLVPTLTPLEQAGYKYILHLPGHSCAYRLSLELYFGSVIFLYPCMYTLWYSDWLVPYEHYIPIDPKNPKDIYNKISWAKKNDARCKQIALNARQFAETYLSREYILNYLQGLLWALHQRTGYTRYTRVNLDTMFVNFSLSRISYFEKQLTTLMDNQALTALLVSHAHIPRSFRPFFFKHLLDADFDIVHTCEMKEIVKTKNTSVNLFHLEKYGPLVYKKSKKSWKNNCYHTLHIALRGMNTLATKFPNFIQTYASRVSDDYWESVLEYCPGNTFEQYIKRPSTTIHDIIHVWLQITLALHVAQQSMGFLHMDLYPWNIIIREYETPVVCRYPIDAEHSIEILSKTIPVLIDYEKSHFVDNGINMYNTIPFRFCRIQDVISIVFSTLSIFLEKTHISSHDSEKIFSVMNFFYSSYTEHSRFRTLSHIRIFLKRHKKFSKMVLEEKTGLEKRQVLDFFHYCVHPGFPYVVIHKNHMTDLFQPPLVHCVSAELDALDAISVSQDIRRSYVQMCKDRFETIQGMDPYRKKCLERQVYALLEKRLDGLDIVLPDVSFDALYTMYVKHIELFQNTKWQRGPGIPLFLSHLCHKCIQRTVVPAQVMSMDNFVELLSLALGAFPHELKNCDLFFILTTRFTEQFQDFLLTAL